MPTTFNVFSLGTGPLIDPTEGNNTAENASALVGQTYGSSGDPLFGQIQSLSPGSTGFGGGITNAYDTNNNGSNDTFSLDGGPDQTHDGGAAYDATLTYADGSQTTLSVIVMQDTAGNLYLIPWASSNSDQDALEAKAVLSITLDTLVANSVDALIADREVGSYVTPDGTVDGTAGDDTIGSHDIDAQGDQVDGFDGDNDTIDGGAGNDSILAGSGDDSIQGGDGMDTLSGELGHDTLHGGTDNDSLFGNAGNDSLFGDGGNDGLSGGDGDDSLLGGDGMDTLSGDQGHDTLHGGGDDDTLYGDSGNDSLLGDGGNDHLDGGGSNDTLDGGLGNDSLRGDSGNDSLLGGDGMDTLSGGLGRDTLDGGADNDSLYGDVGNDSLYGGDNDDYLSGGSENDTLDGGSGNDSLLGDDGGDSLLGGDGMDTLSGGKGQDTLEGGAHNDSLYGDDGNDSLFGGADNDYLSGGADDDSLDGGTGDDTLDGGTGDDTLDGGTGDDTLFGGDGSDSMDGGSGSDHVVFTGAHSDYSFDVIGTNQIVVTDTVNGGGADTVSGFEYIEFSDGLFDLVIGTAGDDYQNPFGSLNEDFILGGDGADTLLGTGTDVLIGGDGQDVIHTSGADTVFGGTGDDSIGFMRTSVVDGGTGTDTLDATHGSFTENLVFNSATGGTDTVDGGTFDNFEVFQSGDGSDFYDASLATGNLTFETGAHQDTVTGGSGNDLIDGETGHDSLDGGAGDDTVLGGDGDDTLSGGAGADSLTGGAGADHFVVDDGGDTITDFDVTTGIDGGVSTDNDFVDLSGYYNSTTLATWNAGAPAELQFLTPLQWLRADQADDGSLGQVGGARLLGLDSQPVPSSALLPENTGVACFTKGTLIATARGAVPIERLMPGDMIQTMDHGFQPLRWIGSRHLDAEALGRQPKLRPIRISPKAQGRRTLVNDLIVSPQHRMLVTSKVTHRMFGETEVLVAAKKLLALDGVEVEAAAEEVTYFHLLFDSHEIIFANGVPAESLYLGTEAQKALTPKGRAEIYSLFPEVESPEFVPQACRRIVSGAQAARLCLRHAKNQRPIIDPMIEFHAIGAPFGAHPN